jgi:hypothetical protein
VLIFLKEMLREQWIKPDADYTRFKAQLERIPVAALPEDRRFNPLAMNPYVLFKALGQTKHYSTEELIQAMDLLLDCNHKLVFSGREEALVLQHTFIKIISRTQKAR